jgi:hypothetical protein
VDRQNRHRALRTTDCGEHPARDAGATHPGDHDCARPTVGRQPRNAGIVSGAQGLAHLRARRRDRAEHLAGIARSERLRVVEETLVDLDPHLGPESAASPAWDELPL